MNWIDTIIYRTLITFNSVKVEFVNGKTMIGYFEPDENFDALKSEGKLRFVKHSKVAEIVKADEIAEFTIL